ncbi:hypothetical protein [Syntrophomonas wolfei]|nr:hypothetical protein [Syntrophomonas wolfei]
MALREDRPYRNSMSWEQIAGIMNEMAQAGDLEISLYLSIPQGF